MKEFIFKEKTGQKRAFSVIIDNDTANSDLGTIMEIRGDKTASFFSIFPYHIGEVISHAQLVAWYEQDAIKNAYEGDIFWGNEMKKTLTQVHVTVHINAVSYEDPVNIDMDLKIPVITSSKGGSFTENTTISIATESEDADIYYSINDAKTLTPNNGIKYTNTFVVEHTCMIKAIAVRNGLQSIAASYYICNTDDPISE